MPAPEPEAIAKRYERSRGTRGNFENLWQQILDYMMPARSPIIGEEAEGEQRLEYIFDSTGIDGADEFTSRLAQGLMPDHTQWFKLEAGTNYSALERFRIQPQLDEIDRYVWQVMQSGSLYSQVDECAQDVGIGWCAMQVEEDFGVNPVRYSACPMRDTYLDRGPFGDVDGVFRPRRVRPSQIQVVWPKARLTEKLEYLRANGDEPVEILQAVYRDWEARTTELYYFDVIYPAEKERLLLDVISGHGSKPIITPRWRVAAGEVYGRGPFVNALPDTKTVNLTEQYVLENAELAILGLWQYPDEGAINVDAITLKPGTVIPYNEAGELRAVNSPSRFDVAEILTEKKRESIRSVMLAQNLGPLAQTPRSATEVQERQADRAERIGSPISRLIREWCFPVVLRTVHVLRRKGLIELPMIDGREIRVVATSPLARALEQMQILGTTQFLQMVGGIFGPRVMQTFINPDNAIPQLAQWHRVPSNFLRSPAERRQAAEQMGQAMQQAEQQAPGAGAAIAQAAVGG